MRPLRPLGFTIKLAALSGAALFAGAAGCSLGGLVFDIPSEGTGGGTGSSASSNTGGAAQSSASTGGFPQEICTNGSDDDGDGTIDCNDLDCMQTGYSCVDPIPADWIPVLFFHDPVAEAPACPATYPNTRFQGGFGLSFDPADCNPCSCTPPGLSCNHPDIGVFTDEGCVNVGTYTFEPTTGTQCGEVTMTEAGYGFGAAFPTVNVPGCEPQGGGISLSDAKFEQSAIVCSADGVGTCANPDQVCTGANVNLDSFHPGGCIFREGFHECPAPYDDRHVLGTEGEYDDTRSCSSCSCTSPDNFSCDLSYTLYSDTACMTSVLTFPADESCNGVAAGVTAASYKASFSFNGSCAASGGKPEGTVRPKTPMTVCCTQ
jgi:hypothetical protein